MKPVNFFRNAWRKLEQKTSSEGRPEDRKELPKRPHQPAKQSLTITVNHLPLQDTTIANIDGTWRTYQPPSPIYDQFTQHRSPSRACSDASPARAQGPSTRKLDSPTHKRYGTLHASPSPYSSLTGSLSSTNVVWPKKAEPRPSPAHKRPTLPPGPQSSPSTCELLPPLDLSDSEDSENQLDPFVKRDGGDSRGHQSKRYSDSQRRDSSIHAPRNRIGSMTTPTTSRHHRSPASVQAVLDLSFHAREGSLYQKSTSTPHLLCPSTSDVSAEGSDIESFPLSLFPSPPPLVVPKKVPPPLVLKSSPAHSSRDSTPLSTPTTPRFYSGGPPSSQLNVNSPSKKVSFARSASHYSPPPFSPPTTPLPAPPRTPSKAGDGTVTHSNDVAGDRPRPSLRNARSNVHLRKETPLPFPAMHRLTASEPITDRSPSRPPFHRPVKLRSEPLQVKHLQRRYVAQKEGAPGSGTEAPVEWGYAL